MNMWKSHFPFYFSNTWGGENSYDAASPGCSWCILRGPLQGSSKEAGHVLELLMQFYSGFKHEQTQMQGHLRQSLPTLTQMTFWAECASRQHFEQCASLQKWCRSVELPSRRGSARRVVGLKHHAALPLHHVRQGPCQLCLHWHLLGSFPILLQLLPSAQPIMGLLLHWSKV